MLTPEEQGKLLKAHPDAFTPAAGAWGRRGSTVVQLDAVDAATLRKAIASAWQARAPKRVAKR